MDQIVASLRYGKIWRKGIIIWYFILALGLFCLGFSFVFLFGYEHNWVGFICGIICFVIFSGISLYIIIKNFINIKQCKKWLRDAVKLNATTKGLKIPNPTYNDIFLRKLEVTFRYEGKRHIKYSGTKRSNGYDRFFYKFEDRKISILYSPKFDEVMILKD